MLDDGVCATIKELASRERANRRYMSRVLREKMRSGDDETEAGVGQVRGLLDKRDGFGVADACVGALIWA